MDKKWIKNWIKNIHEDLEIAISLISKRHNVIIKVGTIGVGHNDFSVKLEGCVSISEDVEKELFEKDCMKVGLKPTAYGLTFKREHEEYKIVGIKPAAKKYPVVITNTASDKSYKLDIYTLKSHLSQSFFME